MAHTINNNQLEVGATYLVRGKIGFSHVAKPTTDEERTQANKRRMHPIDKNYTSISIFGAQVICRDPKNPSTEEKYAAECFYKSSSPAYPGNNFTAMNKSKNLPRIGVVNTATPNQYDEISLNGKELAVGLDVTLIMRVFKGQGNNGVSLDTVLVNEPVRFFDGGSHGLNEQLSAYGITFNALNPASVAPETTPASPEANPAATAAPVPAPETTPAPAPAPTAPAVSDDNPFSSYGMDANNITFGAGTRQY
jgi:hypothetical protein